MDRRRRPNAINPSPNKNLDLLDQQSPTSQMPRNELGELFKKAILGNDLQIKFIKWREISADRNQWRAVCGSDMPSQVKSSY
jgi:hypothetical protein